MLLIAAAVLLVAWLLGAIGVYDGGSFYNMFLMVGLLLLMLGVLKGRDAAASRPPDSR